MPDEKHRNPVHAEMMACFDGVFANRHDTYARQHASGAYARVEMPLDELVWRRHFSGEETVAVYALNRASRTRWLCFDSDAPDGLVLLLHVQEGMAALGLPSLREASRRGGHLWVLFARLQPAVLVRAVARGLVALLQVATPARDAAVDGALDGIEVYPSSDTVPRGGVGRAVRAPLGIHQRTGQWYPFLAPDGQPAHGMHQHAALTWLLEQPLVTRRDLWAALAQIEQQLAAALDTTLLEVAALAERGDQRDQVGQADGRVRQQTATLPRRSARPVRQTGASFDVIPWVNTALALPDLMAETTPGVDLRKSGRGWTGWCPWHEDTALQGDGSPGTPSLYVVNDYQHGWSWRCYSTNCGAHQTLMHDTFDWVVWLAAGNRERAIAWAYERYHQLHGQAKGDSDTPKRQKRPRKKK